MNRIVNYLWPFLISFALCAQNNTVISGLVKDHQQNPLPFATVGVIGSSIGTITNLDGAFDLYLQGVDENDTLLISYVGFESVKITIEQASKGELVFELNEDIIMLDEVQVSGEQLTGTQIIQRALDKIDENFSATPFVMSGMFRDIREQNGETVYLVDASVDVKDPGFKAGKSIPKHFFLKGVRSSDNRINDLLSGSYLNTRSALGMLRNNYWLGKMISAVKEEEFKISDIVKVNDRSVYVITLEEIVEMDGLAEKYKDMKFKLTHRYFIDTETYAIHQVEHLEDPMDGKYIGIEPPYEGDSLFYSKKGWNQIIGFEEFNGQMHLKYHDISYAFDIVNEKQEQIYLDMSYRFTFVVTDVDANKKAQPEGEKMNSRKSLSVQTTKYDSDFWKNPENAKLVPLTQKQLKSLEKHRPLIEQFKSTKSKRKKT